MFDIVIFFIVTLVAYEIFRIEDGLCLVVMTEFFQRVRCECQEDGQEQSHQREHLGKGCRGV